MAKKRDAFYIVPMPLERSLERLEQMAELGIVLQETAIDPDHYDYKVQRLLPGRNGRQRVVDEAVGHLQRSEDNMTRIEPRNYVVPLWKITIFYLACIVFGFLLALLLGALTEPLGADFPRRVGAVFILYCALFLLVQPQRLVFRGGDARLSQFVKDVLSGPYADAQSLYEHHFPGIPYWERHYIELEEKRQQRR